MHVEVSFYMNYKKEAKSLTFRRGSEVSQAVISIFTGNRDPCRHSQRRRPQTTLGGLGFRVS